jgi:acyl-coenzyme A thioesterase PaaI-like protein
MKVDVYEQLKTFINEKIPFVKHCGVSVTALTDSGAQAVLPESHQLLNHVGTQHAGALFTAAETASGACMLGLVGDRFSTVTPVVRNSSIIYRRPAAGAIVAAAHADLTRQRIHDELSRQGRCDFTVNVEMRDQGQAIVASAEMAWHLRVRGGAERSA